MNNVEKLKKTLSEVLCSDELDETFYYLDEYKRLKQKELINKVDFVVEYYKNNLTKKQQLAVLTDIVDMDYSKKTKNKLIKILSGGFE
jgi:hypothetical protein